MLQRLLIFLVISGLILSACSPVSGASEPTAPPAPTATESSQPSPTSSPTETPLPTETPTPVPTETPVPTSTRTRKPTSTPIGGGSGDLLMFVSLNIIKLSIDQPLDYDILISSDELMTKLGVEQLSTHRTDFISPDGKLAAFWNCASVYCDYDHGPLHLFTTDWKQKISIDVPGFPSFKGMSATGDRLLYYLSSIMADDYYLVTTTGSDFGKVITLEKYLDVTWAPDGQTLYAQKGSTVYHLDKDGEELETFQCNWNNACMNAPSPDGRRFAGIQKFVPTGTGNPVINISNQDFTDKETIFLSDDDVLILSLTWLPDNEHLLVFGQSVKQRIRRFWRLDYLSIINVDTGEERVFKLDIPEDAETFYPCGLTPDASHMVYLGAGGRIKKEGRILMSGRFAQMFPIDTVFPQFERITSFPDTLESCPVWLP